MQKNEKNNKNITEMSVDEVVELLKPEKIKVDGTSSTNRFSKKNFDLFLLAVLNDPEYTVKVTKSNGKNKKDVEIKTTKAFRKWMKEIIMTFGVDSKEADVILTENYKFNNVRGFYEFMASIIYDFMIIGNKFDFLPKEDFKGSLSVRHVKEKKRTYKARNPKTGESMGMFEATRKDHKELSVKNSCPKWLTEKRKLK